MISPRARTLYNILAELQNARGQPVSGAYLAQKYKISRTAVWKTISSLRAQGFEIEAGTNKGYILKKESDALSQIGIYAALSKYSKKSAVVLPNPEQIHVYPAIDSTNTAAKKAAAACPSFRSPDGKLAPEGKQLHKSVFCADTQTAGRGRQGRSFHSPAGKGLYFSLIYVPDTGIQKPAVLTASAAVAVCRSIRSLYGIECSIKWVNDIYYAGKKVCGILTEGIIGMETLQIEAAIIGIGINIQEEQNGYPNEIKQTAGSLFGKNTISSGFPSRNELAADILYNLFSILHGEIPQNEVFEEYRSLSILLGKEITFYPLAGNFSDAATDISYTAKALDITDEAQLIVELADGSRLALDSGEVTLHGGCIR